MKIETHDLLDGRAVDDQHVDVAIRRVGYRRQILLGHQQRHDLEVAVEQATHEFLAFDNKVAA